MSKLLKLEYTDIGNFCSLNTEITVLGRLMWANRPSDIQVQQAILLLDDNCFMNRDNRIIFNSIKSAFNSHSGFSAMDISAINAKELEPYIYEIMESVVPSDSIMVYANKLLAYKTLSYQLKILISTLKQVNDEILPESALSMIANEIKSLNQSSQLEQTSIRTYEQIADELLAETEQDDSQIKIDIPGFPLVPNRGLITIAGRSGVGKTFFGIYFMDKLIDALPEKQTLYFNLEMHERVMLERHSIILGFQGYNRKEIIKAGLHLLLPKNVSLISQPLITIDEIEIQCRLSALRQPIAVIVVDYIGLITMKKSRERNDLSQSEIAKRLAALSIELNCVVIALTQVNRESSKRLIGDRCPLPSDSSESMGTVHSSSWWLGIDRPSLDSQEKEYEDLFQVACRKNRGESGLFKIDLDFKLGRFYKRERKYAAIIQPKNESKLLK